jgi:hypothetical protein
MSRLGESAQHRPGGTRCVAQQSDKAWWSTLPDPPRNVGNALLSRITNIRDLLWVDFTAYDIWPPQWAIARVADLRRGLGRGLGLSRLPAVLPRS